MKKIFVIIAVFISISGIGFLLFAQEDTHVTQQVTISGLVDSTFVITMDNIQNFPIQEVETEHEIVCSSGAITTEIHSFKGILLKDLIDLAGAQVPEKKVRGQFYVYVMSSDGYNVIFALNELNHGPAGENAYLLFEQNGEPLYEEGKFVVICTSDLKSGPRHVKWVDKIEVRRAV